MNRRNAFKNIVLASGSLITLPLWMQSCGISDKNTHQSSFSVDEQELLAAVADTIIPTGNSIGALSVGVDKFLQKLLDDCYEQPVQDNVKKQLWVLNGRAKMAYGNTFKTCTQQQREALLLKLSFGGEREFFDLVKKETIRGFNTSQKVMVDYLNYKIAPGHYYGCVNVKA